MEALSFEEAYLAKFPEGALARDILEKRVRATLAEGDALSARIDAIEKRRRPEAGIVRKAAGGDSAVDVVAKRARALVDRDATLTVKDAVTRVLNEDGALYASYCEETSTTAPKHVSKAEAVAAEIERRAAEIVAKAGGSQADAVAQVLNSDPELYARYRKATSAS